MGFARRVRVGVRRPGSGLVPHYIWGDAVGGGCGLWSFAHFADQGLFTFAHGGRRACAVMVFYSQQYTEQCTVTYA